MNLTVITEGKPSLDTLPKETRKALVDDLLEEIIKDNQEGG